MSDVVYVGSVPDDGTGDPLRTAFQNINAMLDDLQAVSPITVGILNPLTIDNTTTVERSAKGTTIGTISGKSDGTILRLADPNEYRFQIVGTELQCGPWILDQTTTPIPIDIEEFVDTGTATNSKITTFNISVTQDAGIASVVPTVWAAPTAQGTGDGSSAGNAKAISSIPGTLVPGDIVGVRADLGTYNLSTISLTSSGVAGNPIKWIGVNAAGRRTLAKFTAGRWPYRKQTHDVEEVIMVFTISPTNTGGNVFGIGNISYVTFEDLAFEDVGICFNVGSTLSNPSNLTFNRMYIHNCQRFLEHGTTNGHNNFLIDTMVARGFSKVLIRHRGTGTNLTTNNIDADSERQDNDNWASLVMMDQNSIGWTGNNVTARNCHNNQGNDYWNADGSSTEEVNDNIVLTNYVSTGHTDGGIDSKAYHDTYTDCYFGDNKRNIKLWRGKKTIIRPTFGKPFKRGGTGSAVMFDIESGTTANTAVPSPEIYVEDADLRVDAWGVTCFQIGAGIGIQTTGVCIKLVNCQTDTLFNFESPSSLTDVRLMRADVPKSSIPTTAISATTSISIASSSTGFIPIATDRDASYGGVLVRSITGADAASFTLPDYPLSIRFLQGVFPVTGLAAGTYHITLLLEDIIGTQTSVDFTITAAAVDQRVFDVTFTGANNSQTATDVSPHAHALTWGTNAKIMTTIDPAGRLRIPFTANGTGTGKVSSPDSPDWQLTSLGEYTVIASGVNLDTAATGIVQHIFGQLGTTNQSVWRIYVDATGHVCFDSYNSSGNLSFTLADTTARTNATDFDVKVTRESSGGSYLVKLYVNGTMVASTTTTNSMKDGTNSLGIGANGVSNSYMAGYIKRVAIYLGTHLGT
jgi:hypothetical protein